MVRQYPYFLQVLTKAEATQDYEGNWVPGVEKWVTHSKCRDVSGSGKQIKGTDGSVVTITFVAHCPKGTAALEANKQVRIIDGNDVRVTGKVLYSDKAQLHTKIIC
jgi:hypothetical protein